MKAQHPKRGAVFALVILAFLFSLGDAAAAPVFVDWSVPGAPYDIAVQSPDTVWATLPASNAILRVQVSPEGVATTNVYTVPTANAEPYKITFSGNAVWFTERVANKIGRLDPASGVITEFLVPTANSEPTGIAVIPGPPDQVWFTERAGNALGLLSVTSPTSYTFIEYPLPWPNAHPESIAAEGVSRVWFTAPGASGLGFFNLKTNPPSFPKWPISTGVGSKPWALDVADGYPWMTERQMHRVGVYLPQTFADIRWFTAPPSNSDPYDVSVFGELVGFAQRASDSVRFLNSRTQTMRSYSLPGAAPTSIQFDANGCAWIAENGANKIARLCAPYVKHRLYLPVVEGR